MRKIIERLKSWARGERRLVWQFIWRDGRVFTASSKAAVEAYASGAFGTHGKNCGRIKSHYRTCTPGEKHHAE